MRARDEYVIEAERYEMSERGRYRFAFSRREFFKRAGGGLVVLFLAPSVLAQESGGTRRRRRGFQGPSDVNAWLHVGEDGTISVFTGKVEIGQNARTSLTQAVAEELRAPIESIKIIMGDTLLVPFDAGTFGSQTTPQMASRLHAMGATAREALLDLAADHFKADRAGLVLDGGKIFKSSAGESIGFGELTKGQKLVKSVSHEGSPRPVTEWKIAGTSTPKVNGRAFVTGRHKYSSDVQLPGMLHGRILRPPAYHASLSSIDTKSAEAMPGVTVVHEGEFIGAAAPDSFTAERAVDAITTNWTKKDQIDSAELFDHLRKTAREGRAEQSNEQAPAANEDAFKTAAHRLKATYTIAYIAHTPLEPRAAVASWDADKLTVWTGTQRPFGVRSELAEAFGMPEDKIRVIVPDTGAGYGGKHTGEVAVEAARLAKAAGKPVKVAWTRQEEFTWAYFRPAGVIDIDAGLRGDGTISAWEMHNYNSGGSGIRSPYEIPAQKCVSHAADSPLRQGSYRALAATANNFARESHMDDLAAAVKMDPLEFRLKNLSDSRLRDVLHAAAEKFGWGSSKARAGHGFGLAAAAEKGSYLATAVEVLADKDSGSVKVLRAVSAFDCGAVVNPDQLKNQIEGALVMGIGGAMFEAVEFENGMVTNARMADYEVPRFSDSPKIDVVLVDRKDIRSAGAGETPIICIAPAIGNAIFNAAQIRLRSMPMVPDGLKT